MMWRGKVDLYQQYVFTWNSPGNIGFWSAWCSFSTTLLDSSGVERESSWAFQHRCTRTAPQSACSVTQTLEPTDGQPLFLDRQVFFLVCLVFIWWLLDWLKFPPFLFVSFLSCTHNLVNIRCGEKWRRKREGEKKGVHFIITPENLLTAPWVSSIPRPQARI